MINIFSAIFLLSTVFFKPAYDDNHVIHLHPTTLNTIAPELNKLLKRYHIQISGTGGCFRSSVYKLDLTFEYQRPISEEEARTLYKNITDDVQNIVNQTKPLRPYLIRYPLQKEDLNIDILFHKVNSRFKLYSTNSKGELLKSDLETHESVAI